MGFGKRLLDLARANLNALLDAEGQRQEARVEELTDEELEGELARRRDRRRREIADRAAAAAAERAAHSRAAERRSGNPASPPPPSPGAADGSGAARSSREGPPPPRARFAGASEAQRVARLYAILETPNGADLDTVKRNFRQLMRRHHPDLHAGSVEEQRRATEKSAQLTVALSELENVLSLRRRG